ncbi:unnamed protein product [Prorocentrum cordatum]|uniref:RING-type domain-containing protein n=1 Tax=Prorocentrum cordatum TaxID=2364126 RepID=A0ABN9URE9_9DINO|nr:unnamed protein product [Polarella glacialis]
MSAVREVHRLEEQHWSEGWSVQLRGVPGHPELRGRRALTRGLEAAEGGHRRFVVEVESAAGAVCYSVPLEQLAWPFGDQVGGNGSAGGGSATPAVTAALEAARAFFRPGSQFRGTIAIPGMATSSGGEDAEASRRREYTLEVVEESVDELGGRSLMARHAAYEDVQTCHIAFEAVEAPGQPVRVKVVFADGETCCEGTIGPDQLEDDGCAFRGKVMQLVQGEEGFYERSTEVTHFFELFRITSCEVEAERARRIEQARRRRLDAVSAWAQEPRGERLGEEERSGLRGLPWGDIIHRDAVHRYEDVCARLRRQSALLDSLAFATREEKEQVLAGLRDAGVCRAAAHEATDAVMALIRNLVSLCVPLMLVDGRQVRELQVFVLKGRQRIARSYSQLDQSLRSAEARPPRDVLAGWLRPPGAGADPCSVCFLALEASAESVRLPCGHWFHLGCISQWLHARATCPNCRVALDAGCPDGMLYSPLGKFWTCLGSFPRRLYGLLPTLLAACLTFVSSKLARELAGLACMGEELGSARPRAFSAMEGDSDAGSSAAGEDEVEGSHELVAVDLDFAFVGECLSDAHASHASSRPVVLCGRGGSGRAAAAAHGSRSEVPAASGTRSHRAAQMRVHQGGGPLRAAAPRLARAARKSLPANTADTARLAVAFIGAACLPANNVVGSKYIAVEVQRAPDRSIASSTPDVTCRADDYEKGSLDRIDSIYAKSYPDDAPNGTAQAPGVSALAAQAVKLCDEEGPERCEAYEGESENAENHPEAVPHEDRGPAADRPLGPSGPLPGATALRGLRCAAALGRVRATAAAALAFSIERRARAMEPEWARFAFGGLLRALQGCCALDAPGRDGEMVVQPPDQLAARRGWPDTVGFAGGPPREPAAAAAVGGAGKADAAERGRGWPAAASFGSAPPNGAPAEVARRRADEPDQGADRHQADACPDAACAAACCRGAGGEFPDEVRGGLDECDVSGLRELMRQFVREAVFGRAVDVVVPGEGTESGCLRLTEDLRFLQLETRGVVHEIPVKSVSDVRSGELPGPCSTAVRPDELCSTILMKNGECVTFGGHAERDTFTKCAKTLTIASHL